VNAKRRASVEVDVEVGVALALVEQRRAAVGDRSQSILPRHSGEFLRIKLFYEESGGCVISIIVVRLTSHSVFVNDLNVGLATKF
jgi:hypothetical protein